MEDGDDDDVVDDDDNDKFFCGMGDQRKAFSLISSRHHCESPTRRKQDLNLRRT